MIPRKIRAVVTIIGPGLRPEERRDEEYKEEEFCKRAMLMFVPHEHVTDLRTESSSWIEAWSTCSSVCSTGLAFIRFNEDRWQSIFRSQEASIRYFEQIQSELDNCAGESNGKLVAEKCDINEWDDFSDDENLSDSEDDEDITQRPYIEYAERSNTKHTHTKVLPKFDTREVYIPPKNALKVDLPRTADFNRFEKGLEKVIEGASTDNDDASSGNYYLRELSIKEMFTLVQSSIDADDRNENNASKSHASIRDSYLNNATRSTIEVFVDSPKFPKTLPCYASLQEVSSLFKLTNDQHRAFVIIGRALLHSFEPNHSNTKLAVTTQEFLLLHGLAGSGKSFVVRAWKALAESWEHPKAVRTCAPTG